MANFRLEDYECESRHHIAGTDAEQRDYDAQREYELSQQRSTQEGIILKPDLSQHKEPVIALLRVIKLKMPCEEINYRIIVECGCEDGADDQYIGHKGTIATIDGDYAEVKLDGKGDKTFLFGLYQLKKL